MKLRTLVKAPALTQSGYGVHSRQVIFALLNDPTFDVYLEPINWGVCAHLLEDTQEKRVLTQLHHKFAAARHQKQDENWDLFIHITIPNEFERRGKMNVGITAGTETDRVSHVWLQKCNEMDLLIVPSEHARRSFLSTIAEWSNPQTKETGTLRLEKPMVVCPEGVNTAIFHKLSKPLPETVAKLDFAPDFNFLSVGQWGNGGYDEDRKNIALLVRYFIEAFIDRKDVGLVLKINMARNSTIDHEMVVSRLNQIKANYPAERVPPIYLLHGHFTDEEMAGLYNHPKVKALVSLTHGEGFGLPLLEAAACELPIVATDWSGHLDFLRHGLFSAVSFNLRDIPPAAVWDPILIQGSRWACVDEADAKRRMQKMVESYGKPTQWAKELGAEVRQKFGLASIQKTFLDTLSKFIQEHGSACLSPSDHLASQVDSDPETFTVLYTMPMSTGDVFISTAVIDGLLKKLKKEHENIHVYFATSQQYLPILEGNPNIHKVIPWQEYMMDVDLCEQVFDLVLTPNVATQFTFSNWVRRGHGRLLAEEFANHCQCELGDYFIKEDDSIFTDILTANGGLDLRHTPYVTFHPGSGTGQWEARKYQDWREVVQNIKGFYPQLQVVQVGGSDEPLCEGVLDMRGKSTPYQLASLIRGATLHLSIDTFTMHLAAAMGTPLVAIFGSSHASSTGPWTADPNAPVVLLESETKMGCDKACYKYTCRVNRDMPCINEIDPSEIVKNALGLLKEKLGQWEPYNYQRVYGKISGYTTSYNAETMGYPYLQSIKSMLGFCDEVVVVDHSTDGTYEILEKLAAEEPRIQLYQREWDTENPTMDGDAKAFARALCTNEFCWQQDLDEVVHEADYDKIKLITKRFPSQADILHLPVVECWGDEKHVTGRRHAWKWRLSKNLSHITHGVNKHARLTDEKTGRVYAREGMSDSCEYVDLVSYEMLPHVGFYTQQLDMLRVSSPAAYAETINSAFDNLPCVFHYSWFDIPQKIRQFRVNWDKQWRVLYQTENKERFPGVDTEEQIQALAKKLKEQGGEDCDQVKYSFELKRSHPAVMADWIAKHNAKL